MKSPMLSINYFSEENPSPSQLIIYQTQDGKARLEVRMDRETVWLSQNQMADLFQTTKQNVSLHIKNIFSEGELREDSVVKDFLTTASDGKNYQTPLQPRRHQMRNQNEQIKLTTISVISPKWSSC